MTTPTPLPEPYLAPALVALREQINAFSPKRSKVSDGWIGNAAHTATKSDHNPLPGGLVLAVDITNDPPNEVHCGVLVEALRASRDPRIAYIIYNHYMMRSYERPGIPAWTWAPYTGPSPHDHHMHVSVTKAGASEVRPWRLTYGLR